MPFEKESAFGGPTDIATADRLFTTGAGHPIGGMHRKCLSQVVGFRVDVSPKGNARAGLPCSSPGRFRSTSVAKRALLDVPGNWARGPIGTSLPARPHSRASVSASTGMSGCTDRGDHQWPARHPQFGNLQARQKALRQSRPLWRPTSEGLQGCRAKANQPHFQRRP